MSKNISKLLWLVLLFTFSCSEKSAKSNDKVLPKQTKTNHIDTLVVAFVNDKSVYENANYNSSYDKALLRDFAKYQQTPIRTIALDSEYIAKRMLALDSVHIVAHPCVATLAMKPEFQHYTTHAKQKLLLIQSMGANAITNISQLKEDSIHVFSQSAAFRVANLNQEIGGNISIIIHKNATEFDTQIAEIASGKHKYAIVHEQLAARYKKQFPTLDTRTAVSFEQKIGWLTNKNHPELNDSLTNWWSNFPKWRVASLRNRHLNFEKKIGIAQNTDSISPYDDFFKQYADSIAWDWRLLAAIAHQETRFNNESTSHKGAMGIMQIMPRTGALYGLDSISAFDPERNIEASTMHIEHLQKVFRKITDKTEQTYFILAAYNGGASHVHDAMRLARKYGRNKHVWFNNVEYFYKLKNDSTIYTDEVVKFGKTNTKEPVNYVRGILKTYERFLQ